MVEFLLHQFAPVAQWIELSRPKGEIWVRFLVGALIKPFFRLIHSYSHPCQHSALPK